MSSHIVGYDGVGLMAAMINMWQYSNPERSGAEERTPPQGALTRLNILIIDDNWEYADTLRYLLELCGHHADIATDGLTGVRQALMGAYTAIICDIGLPGLSGYEVAKRLRSDPTTSNVRMIAVTAYGSDDAKRQCYAAGFDGHLVKPAPVGDILSQLGVDVPPTLA